MRPLLPKKWPRCNQAVLCSCAGFMLLTGPSSPLSNSLFICSLDIAFLWTIPAIFPVFRRSFTKASKASDTLGDFIRWSLRSGKIARCARCSDWDFRRSPRSAYKIADIWHVRYRQLNSPAFAKRAKSRHFLRLLLRIASKTNPSGWAILSHEFSKLPHRRDRRKKSPGVSASIGGENRLRFSLAIKFAAIGV